MPFGLFKYGLRRQHSARRNFPAPKPLHRSYDVVIIGGGGHGLAIAYYLAKDWGITNIAVLEKGYLAGGNTTRHTAIIRSNYLTPEGVGFYDESVRMKVVRQWAGMDDMTPDFSPIMGKTPVLNYYIDSRWGAWGFKPTPVCGKRMAETLATDSVPDVLQPFALERFYAFNQVGERGAASVGHYIRVSG